MPLTHKLSKSTIYVLAVVYASMAAMTAGSLVYANHAAAQSAKNWCDVVVTLDEAYKTTPPTTPVGVKLAQEMHDLRGKLDCKGVKPA